MLKVLRDGRCAGIQFLLVLLALTAPWITSAQDSVDVKALVGRWFLMYTDKNTSSGFAQKDLTCIVVDASLSSSSSTQLMLTVRMEQGGSSLTQTASVAQDPLDPARFSAVLQSDPTITWFRILYMGAMEAGQYSYIIVQTEGTAEQHLYVLYTSPEADHTNDMLNFLGSAGIQAPTAVEQGVGCAYAGGNTDTTSTSSATTALPSRRVQPVSNLVLSSFLGRWYQMITNDNTRAAESRSYDGVCNTATYCSVNKSAITIYNTQRLSKPTGELEDIEGIAVLTDEPGVLSVRFEASPNTILWEYLVIELGPQEGEDNLYSYVIVTDASMTTVFVLGRNRKDFGEKYEVDVIASLLRMGFTGVDTKPQIVLQDTSCLYPRSLDGVTYKSPGCGPDEGVPSSYWIGLLVVGLILGIGLALGASYFLRKRGRNSNYGAF